MGKINSLIDPVKKLKTSKQLYSPKEYTNAKVINSAKLFTDSLKKEDRDKYKKMLNLGYFVAENIAELYDVPAQDFVKEVKKII